jgi:hypothetical protein
MQVTVRCTALDRQAQPELTQQLRPSWAKLPNEAALAARANHSTGEGDDYGRHARTKVRDDRNVVDAYDAAA